MRSISKDEKNMRHCFLQYGENPTSFYNKLKKELLLVLMIKLYLKCKNKQYKQLFLILNLKFSLNILSIIEVKFYLLLKKLIQLLKRHLTNNVFYYLECHIFFKNFSESLCIEESFIEMLKELEESCKKLSNLKCPY